MMKPEGTKKILNF